MNAATVNYNWVVSEKKILKTSKENLWKIISSPSNLENFHPFCLKNSVIKWPGNNSIDTIYYKNGMVFERNFYEWNINQGYKLVIGKHKAKKSHVFWDLKQIGDEVEIKIEIYPHLFNKKRKLLFALPFILIVKPKLKNYLKHVLNGLDFYVKTNQKVEINQFGINNWFSK